MKRVIVLVVVVALLVAFAPAGDLLAGHSHHGHSGHHSGGHHYGGHHYSGHHYSHHYGSHLSYGHHHHSPYYSYRSYYPSYNYYPSYGYRSYSYRYPLCSTVYTPPQPTVVPQPKRKIDPAPLPVPGGEEILDDFEVTAPPRSFGTARFAVLKKSTDAHAPDANESATQSIRKNVDTPSTARLGPQLAIPKSHVLASDEEVPWTVD